MKEGSGGRRAEYAKTIGKGAGTLEHEPRPRAAALNSSSFIMSLPVRNDQSSTFSSLSEQAPDAAEHVVVSSFMRTACPSFQRNFDTFTRSRLRAAVRSLASTSVPCTRLLHGKAPKC